MKILFSMAYPGYLRYYGSTVAMLADRGHLVHVAFDDPDRQPEGLRAIPPDHPRIRIHQTPKRPDQWRNMAHAVRATGDYLRYLGPDFRAAGYLRRRVEDTLPRGMRWLARVPSLSSRRVETLIKMYRAVEDAIPSSEVMEQFLAALHLNLVLVTPLVTVGSSQTDIVKSARALGLPTVLCVASWDHLTTKGLIKIVPDRVMVWNNVQKLEAVGLHGIEDGRVIVTGAQPFDDWFGRMPRTSREEFCHRIGLQPEYPYVLFVGSTASISTPAAEQQFVRQWIAALRSDHDPRLRTVGVLVRPHPYNSDGWRSVRLDFPNVTVWPRTPVNPVDPNDRADYFDSFWHSTAVVGINTSAMIEAAIIGRPVHTMLAPEFDDTQQGTLHFHYLVPERGGFVRVAHEMQEHLRNLSISLAGGEDGAQAREFVHTFIRPQGLDLASTPVLVAAVEATGKRRRSPAPARLRSRFLRWALVPLTLATDPSFYRKRLRAAAKRWIRNPVRRGVGAARRVHQWGREALAAHAARRD